jgi:predicted FMN-binding regulatory protein PaiB
VSFQKTETDMDRFEAMSMVLAVAEAGGLSPAAHKTSLATVVADAPVDFIAAHLRGIVGVQIPVARFEGKRKISQNRPEIDRVGVMAGLAASENPQDREVATFIQPAGAHSRRP